MILNDGEVIKCKATGELLRCVHYNGKQIMITPYGYIQSGVVLPCYSEEYWEKAKYSLWFKTAFLWFCKKTRYHLNFARLNAIKVLLKWIKYLF